MSNYPSKGQMQALLQDVARKLDSVYGFASAAKLKVISPIARWLRFDPSNKKGLVIMPNTTLLKSNGEYYHTDDTVHLDFTSASLQAGKEYFVNLADNDTFSVSTTKSATGVTIGRFHTLCVNAGTLTMIAPAAPNSGLVSGSKYLVKPYRQDEDPDFYTFYNKTVSSNATNATYYDTVTIPHPLSGFTAGSILPESVFCLTFKPLAFTEDAMVYDKTTNIAVDVYLQSGMGSATFSVYNATHTVSRLAINQKDDFRMVGKNLLTDAQFTSAAIGSNECTAIQGAADKTTVGGHVDTAGRRMISAIGCEEMCGYLFQRLDELASAGAAWTGTGSGTGWAVMDGIGKFGQYYGEPYILQAGAAWDGGASGGSRCRSASNGITRVNARYGGRGCAKMDS